MISLTKPRHGVWIRPTVDARVTQAGRGAYRASELHHSDHFLWAMFVSAMGCDGAG